ncbi:LOW QUALITY PROTEIN: hypothetical protein PHMEG_00021440 [Phytophthora megakarya]|uniref:Uncharacterized protein n=1 Tax=Phytophthora megakarya TaxID=4795 RepID=A0A225VN41_9STRA|nr:LOW QUALITY PROTEIN: hypothetical protein PHMEG_00021440 [Phytophthora megakarya]
MSNIFWRHRSFERQLTPVQLRDIHTLEDIGSDIQKVEKRMSSRSSSPSSSRRDDKRHSSSSGNYGRHDSRSHSQERSRSEPHHTSRVAPVDAYVMDLITELQTRASSEDPNQYSNDYSNDDPIDFYEGNEADQDECDSDCGSMDELQGEGIIPTKPRDWSWLLTTTNVEMLLTGRSHGATSVHKTRDNSQVDLVKVDFDLRLSLAQGSMIPEFPETELGSMRCMWWMESFHPLFPTMPVQMHDPGKCEAFNELAKIIRTNVDKKNISPELYKLVLGGYLN